MILTKEFLQYFIQYEKKTRYFENSISKKEGENLEAGILHDIPRLIRVIKKKQRDSIFKKVVSYKDIQEHIHEDYYCIPDINNKINELLDKKLTIEEFLDFLVFRYKDNRIAVREFLEKLLSNEFTICFPLLMRSSKEKIIIKPLITFRCHLNQDELLVDEFGINKESLEIIVAFFSKCSIQEVERLEKKNIEELLAANKYENQSNIAEIINILNIEIKTRFNKSLDQFSGYEGWQQLNQIFLSFEVLDEIQETIFRREIQRIIDLSSMFEKVPDLLYKYLHGSKIARKFDSLEQPSNFYLGSYTGEYSVNVKQWHIVNAVNQSELLSVNGPPGTGKTTLLKELIADYVVQKVDLLVQNWNENWTEIMVRNRQFYSVPLNNQRNFSIVLTSTNNQAVDNIGIELLQELEYFNVFLNSEEKEKGIKGFFCARLGNSDNMDIFSKQTMKDFMDGLKSVQDREIDNTIVNKFIERKEELSNLYNEINNFLDLESKLLKLCGFTKSELNLLEKHLNQFVTQRENEKQEKCKLEDTLNLYLDKKEINKEEIKSINLKLQLIEEDIKNAKDSLKKGYQILDTYKKRKKYKLFLWFVPSWRKFFNENPTEEYINKVIINKIEQKIDQLELEKTKLTSNRQSIMNDQEETKNSLNEVKDKITRQKEILTVLEEKINGLEEYLGFAKVLEEKIKIKGIFGKSQFDFFSLEFFYKKRKDLFDLALCVLQQYILKYREEILNNLEMVNNKVWFSPLYSEGHKDDVKLKDGIHALWETIFLCFPVVTTTLHSFKEDTFHLLPGLIDTLLVDEAGQILPHYLCGPLYRSKKAVVVGDIEQLEPIRILNIDLIDSFNHIPENIREKICIQKNCVQDYVDRHSDLYEMTVNNKQKGLILTEHRRCEQNIMEFSNRYVYENSLSIVKRNDHNKLFGNNLVAFDVRGSKEPKFHGNRLEVEVCHNLVNGYVAQYGEGIKQELAIITPFNKQMKLLKDSIPGVEIGTVHTFQGKEKRFIIFSCVIDNIEGKNAGLAEFIGGKTNMLNVAISRAKEQFLLVGNLEIVSKSNNYLAKLYNLIKTLGVSYSPYDERYNANTTHDQVSFAYHIYTNPKDLNRQENSALNQYIKCNFPHFLLLSPKDHHKLLLKSFRLAEQSILIFSPWITEYVVNEEFLNLVQDALSRGIEVRICFGFKGGRDISLNNLDYLIGKDYKSSYVNLEKIKESILKLRDMLLENLKYTPPLHTKLLLIDAKYLFIGSHNWLSKSGDDSMADEVSCLITNKQSIQHLLNEYVKKRLVR